MSAQYRPYRDEVSEEPEVDTLTWSDNDQPGTIKIYEKTTEEIPYNVSTRRRLLLSLFGISLLTLFLGFLIGFFGHSEHTNCKPNLSVALHSIKDENLSIKQKLLELISGKQISSTIEQYSVNPRIPGSTIDINLVQKIVEFFRTNNLDKIEVKNYSISLPEPDIEYPNLVEIIENEQSIYKSRLLKDDLYNLYPYCAYSPAGHLTGDLVFVNYGRLTDLERIRKDYNISFEGKILIAKQFYLSADEQMRNAEAVKAAALLLYPDRDASSSSSEDIQSGKRFPGDMVRSDSVFWNGLGDPQTPGYPATSDAFRLPLESLSILPSIPVQPISANTAFHLLGLMGGTPVPKEWAGLFNFTYRIGPGFQNTSLKVRLTVNNKYQNKTIQNVIGYLRGNIEPDRYIIIGNHRDSWTNGAMDAASGTGILFELVRAFGYLKSEDNWRPRRTLIFASWGAEEYNLIGSTEWIEENYHKLYSRTVAYINIDTSVLGNGSLSVVASPLLYHTLFNATKEIRNPDQNDDQSKLETVYDKWIKTFPLHREQTQLVIPIEYKHSLNIDEAINDYVDEVFEKNHHSDEEQHEPSQQNNNEQWSLLRNYLQSVQVQTRPTVKQLDMRGVYAPFFTLIGIPSVEISYINIPNSSQSLFDTNFFIHTQYDTYSNLKEIDPKFKFHRAIAQVNAELIRDLSDSLFIPFNLFHYAQILRDFYQILYPHANKPFAQNGIDIKLLDSAIHNFTKASIKLHQQQDLADLRDPMAIRRINDQLLVIERAFLSSEGIPRNPMKKHIVLSPGEHDTSYSEMFPGLIDELLILSNGYFDSSKSWNILRVHFSILVNTIQSAATFISDSIY